MKSILRRSLWMILVALGLALAHFLMQAYFSPAEPVEWNLMISLFFGIGITTVGYIKMRRGTRDRK